MGEVPWLEDDVVDEFLTSVVELVVFESAHDVEGPLRFTDI